MTTEETLLKEFGPLITMEQLAKLFDRSVDGLRVSLYQNRDASIKLRSCRLRMGRRIYFATPKIAALLDESVGK